VDAILYWRKENEDPRKKVQSYFLDVFPWQRQDEGSVLRGMKHLIAWLSDKREKEQE
jgi:hypothetical protein